MRPLYLFSMIAVLATAACDRPSIARRAHAVESSDEAALRRVWNDARDYAKPSPDGSLITFVDWTTGDVAVYDIAARTSRRVTDKGSWTENGSWAEDPRFSPDGDRLVYSYGNTEAARPFVYELRVVALNDTTQELLYRAGAHESVYPLDWHERAGVLAILDRSGGAADLIVVDPATRATRVVRTFRPDETDPHRAGFSSDGRFIAYECGGELRIIDAAGASDGVLEERGVLLGWTPDGSGVLFHGDRGGTRGIWMVPLREGRATGPAVLVRDGIPSLEPGGFSRNAYFYLVRVDGPKVQLATVDIENARVLVQPASITSPADGYGTAPAWSPDGTSYAYILSTPGMKQRVMLRSADGEQLRDVGPLGVNRGWGLIWEPNGRSLITVANGEAGWAAYRIDVASGATTKLFEGAGVPAVLTPDGQRLLYLRNAGLFSRSLGGGEERRLLDTRASGPTDLAVSPDGRSVAHVRGRNPADGASRLVTYPIEGGPARLVARASAGSHFEPTALTLAYTPDGRHLLALMGDTAQHHRIVVIPAAGGQPRTLLELGQRREGPERPHARLHPDGRRLLFSTGVPRTEMWLLEDVPGARR